MLFFALKMEEMGGTTQDTRVKRDLAARVGAYPGYLHQNCLAIPTRLQPGGDQEPCTSSAGRGRCLPFRGSAPTPRVHSPKNSQRRLYIPAQRDNGSAWPWAFAHEHPPPARCAPIREQADVYTDSPRAVRGVFTISRTTVSSLYAC